MVNKEIQQDIKDLLARVEGAINLLHRPDIISTDRKLQSIRDKLRFLLAKYSEDIPLHEKLNNLNEDSRN